jgi:hypothetical protein
MKIVSNVYQPDPGTEVGRLHGLAQGAGTTLMPFLATYRLVRGRTLQ